MAGAATAAPIDAAGALYWNPASISGIPGTEMETGLELLAPSARLSSTVLPGALAAGVPAVALSGTDRSASGFYPLPELGLVYSPEGSPLSYGLGLFSVGGFTANYPASTTNPILTPQPPRGTGLGSVFALFNVLQIVPTASYRLGDHLSVGVGPTIDMADLLADPGFLASPDTAAGTGFATFEPATHGHYVWGLGVQAGLFYTTDAGWNFGASVKSPQWFQALHYNSVDQLGRPRPLQLHFDYPLIGSLGASYCGFRDWVLAADLHYVDYHNTSGFRGRGFEPDGTVAGLGWRSIGTVNLGAQYALTEALPVRLGYSYGMNPIADSRSSFNVASPAISEHTIYCGLSYRITAALTASVAYAHAFRNSGSGPLQLPAGPVPGTLITNTVSVDSIIFGATLRF
jgi:long-chain fatty acid transport protein